MENRPRVPDGLRLNLAGVALAVALFAALVVFSPNFRSQHDPRASPFAGDFLQEYLGGYLILHGDRSRFYDLEYAKALQHDPELMGITFHPEQFLPIIYPPFYYLLVSPLALLPFKAAAYVWMGLMVLCLVATAGLLARAYPEQPLLLAWFAPAAMLFAPLLENFASSQKATVALLILAGTYLLLRNRRPFAAGVVFGLLAFKPQLTLVVAVALLLKRQWRFVAGGIVTGVVLVGLSLLVGVDVCRQYLGVTREMATYINMPGFQLEKMHCWYGFFKLLLEGFDLVWVQTATIVASILTIGLLARLLWGPLEEPAFAIQFAGLVLGTVLLSPHMLTYDLTIVLLAIVLLVGTLRHDLVTRKDVESQVEGTLLRSVAKLDDSKTSDASQKLSRRNAQRWIVALLVLLYVLPGFSPQVAAATRVQITVPVMLALLAMLTRGSFRIPRDRSYNGLS